MLNDGDLGLVEAEYQGSKWSLQTGSDDVIVDDNGTTRNIAFAIQNGKAPVAAALPKALLKQLDYAQESEAIGRLSLQPSKIRDLASFAMKNLGAQGSIDGNIGTHKLVSLLSADETVVTPDSLNGEQYEAARQLSNLDGRNIALEILHALVRKERPADGNVVVVDDEAARAALTR